MLTILTPQATQAPAWPQVPSWLSRLLRARGVESAEEAERFLHPSLDQLLPPEGLHDLERACALLRQARDAHWPTVVYGDYDVDGVSACAILLEAFSAYGLKCEAYIPDRHQEGYGLNLPAVEDLAARFRLMVTVDCGITSVAEVAAARARGMRVIVTDHHRHGESLPEADAVVSPLLGGYGFPFLCGAGVAWKLALALIGEKALPLLPIAALATIADMVPLTGENRVIAACGLEGLMQTDRPGLRAVMERAGIRDRVTSEQVAFQIAPRMNACGRLETARIALDMLLTHRQDTADALALKMESLNQRRRDEEALVLREALSQVREMDLTACHAIVVCGEGWNSGVVGLAAGKIAETYAYPTVALARTGEMCVGSARSAGDIDIHAALSQCADLFEKFGGHRQAAGLTIRTERVDAFRERLSRAVAEQTGGMPVMPTIACDGVMTLREVTEETVRWLRLLEPFGMGNPAPRFLCEGAQPLAMRAVGADGRHLKCTFRQQDDIRDGIFFGGGAYAGRADGSFRLVMTPTVNEFRGKVSAECRLFALQLMPESLPHDPVRELTALFSDLSGEQGKAQMEEAALSDLLWGGQGTLLVCRCRDTALRMRDRFPQADFALAEAQDPRAFDTVLLYGSAARVSAPFRRVVLCDGDLGDAGAWRASLPGAQVAALPLSGEMKRLLAEAFVPMDGLRGCYRALRGQLPRDLTDAAALCGLTAPQCVFAMQVLARIELLFVSFSPFRVSLPPPVKRSPEEDALFCLARRAKEEEDGLYRL